MVEIIHLWPPGMFCRTVNGKPIYSSVAVAKAAGHARVILAGQVSARPDGELVGKGDMAAQIRQVCESIHVGLDHVGATFRDVVRTVTYTVDIPEYFRCQDARFEYFTAPLPPSTLLGVSRLADPDFLVEIEAEAVLPLERLRNA